MRIVFDTTALHKDYGLKQPKLATILASAASRAGWKIAVPRVVIDEICNQFREELEEARAGVRRAARLLSELSDPSEVGAALTKCASEFEKTAGDFRAGYEAALSKSGVIILPYPSISHEEVVARDLRRAKPFNQQGKGYRDFLIWSSLLEWAAQDPNGPDVILVTKNTGDFGDALAPHLVEDLLKKGMRKDLVSRVNSPDDLVAGPLGNELKELAQLAEEIQAGKTFSIAEWVADSAVAEFSGDRLRASEVGVSDDTRVVSTRLSAIREVGEISGCSVRRLPDNEGLLVEASVFAQAGFVVEHLVDDPDFEPDFGFMDESSHFRESVDAYVEMQISFLLSDDDDLDVISVSLDGIAQAESEPVNPHD